MSEMESEGFFSDLGDMWDSGVSAADHLGDAALDVGAGVIDTFQTGAQVMIGGAEWALGNEEGRDEHYEAAEDNAQEAIDNFGEAYDEIF